MMASTAPAPPRRWPTEPLGAVTGGGLPPNTFTRASASRSSFSDVPVPWAFTCPMSAGARPASARANSMHAAAPAPPGDGLLTWEASQLRPYPTTSAWMVAPRASARSQSSRTTNPAPSPRTKPSRLASKGRQASAGLSLRSLRTPMRQNEPMANGVTHDSAPPVRTTSTKPSRTRRAASPMAWAPAAHAVVMVMLGPVQPRTMARFAAPALGMSMGMPSGCIRSQESRMQIRSWAMIVSTPPRPVPVTTPHRAGLASRTPAEATASRPAPRASCVTRSRRLASLGVTYPAGSNPSTSQANGTGSSEPSKRRMGAAVPRPARRVDHRSSTVDPPGAFTPSPVMATRRRPLGIPASSHPGAHRLRHRQPALFAGALEVPGPQFPVERVTADAGAPQRGPGVVTRVQGLGPPALVLHELQEVGRAPGEAARLVHPGHGLGREQHVLFAGRHPLGDCSAPPQGRDELHGVTELLQPRTDLAG